MSKPIHESQETRQSESKVSEYKKNTDKFFDQMTSEISQYHNVMSEFQQECTICCKNVMKSALSTQQEFSNKSGATVFVPENYQKMIDDSFESYFRMCALYNESFRRILGAMQQYPKLLSDNSDEYANLASSVFQLYVPPVSKH